MTSVNRTVAARESIVTSARKHNLNPKLIASVLIVESRGNPFAISGKKRHRHHANLNADLASMRENHLFNNNVDLVPASSMMTLANLGFGKARNNITGILLMIPRRSNPQRRDRAKVERIFEFQPPPARNPSVVQETSAAPATDSDSPSSERYRCHRGSGAWRLARDGAQCATVPGQRLSMSSHPDKEMLGEGFLAAAERWQEFSLGRASTASDTPGHGTARDFRFPHSSHRSAVRDQKPSRFPLPG